MSRRSDLLLANLRQLYVAARTAKAVRDDLRDNYAAKLAEANAELDDLQAERNDALDRYNARLALEGLPPITLQDLKDLP